jgi:histidine triad (HIT) family protein
MGHAAELAAAIMPDAFNIITSAGRDATQTVDHLHLHLVPRRPGDGLALPWAAP